MGGGVVGLDEGVDGTDEFLHMTEARSAQCLAREDAEPDLDLVKPRGVRGREPSGARQPAAGSPARGERRGAARSN